VPHGIIFKNVFIEELKQGENVKNFLQEIGLTIYTVHTTSESRFFAYYLINLEQLSQTFGKMFEFYKKNSESHLQKNSTWKVLQEHEKD
jgi:hypothetical protein